MLELIKYMENPLWSSVPGGRDALDLLYILPFQPIRSFTILLFFSVLKDLWYGLWFHIVNELTLQCKIWWVFAFYLDQW